MSVLVTGEIGNKVGKVKLCHECFDDIVHFRCLWAPLEVR